MKKHLLTATILALAGTILTLPAVADDKWDAISKNAKGQTVYFNAWGGSENINDYIEWAGAEVKKRYGVTVELVKITDAAEVVKRIKTEKAAGRDTGGSVDLMWVNGENFRALKTNGLLFGPWAESLPNWQYVDTQKPVQQDFSESTDGLESPWGTAQLTFIADKNAVPQPPRSATELLDFASKHPGRVSYPKPPNFHGTTFLKQLLSELISDPAQLAKPVDPKTFATASQPLWDYLDKLHLVAWRKGKAFPATNAEMHQKLADGELQLSLTFNPNEGANLVAKAQLPPSTYSFGFTKGTIGNVHFVAIPFNAKAKEGAQVFANFLLSPEAQVRKADINVWGDPSVLDAAKLTAEQRAVFKQRAPGGLTEVVPTLAEPHATWVEALETEWLKRYGSQ
ncbi:MAG: ABC transporter substrate-binding protein [Proteobacteria bacterium]|nr:MAG: ABC transporter substrate-binding protein [Pseudomonadota bacterium]